MYKKLSYSCTKYFRLFIILSCSFILTIYIIGCSRQSLTDFTPYPMLQANLKVNFDFETPYSFKSIDNTLVEIKNIKLFVDKIKLALDVSKNRVLLRGAIRTDEHHHDEHHHNGDNHSNHNHDEINDITHGYTYSEKNILQPDTRHVLPNEFLVHKLLSSGKHYLTEINSKLGAQVTLKLYLKPTPENQNIPLYIDGTVKFPGKVASSTFSIKIDHELELQIPYSLEQQLGDISISFKPEKWFENIYLSQLFGSETEFEIDHENPILVHRFIDNFIASVYLK